MLLQQRGDMSLRNQVHSWRLTCTHLHLTYGCHVGRMRPCSLATALVACAATWQVAKGFRTSVHKGCCNGALTCWPVACGLSGSLRSCYHFCELLVAADVSDDEESQPFPTHARKPSLELNFDEVAATPRAAPGDCSHTGMQSAHDAGRQVLPGSAPAGGAPCMRILMQAGAHG